MKGAAAVVQWLRLKQQRCGKGDGGREGVGGRMEAEERERGRGEGRGGDARGGRGVVGDWSSSSNGSGRSGRGAGRQRGMNE